ncbi:MFS multidrug transporter-like protein [Apodospora peruviana]|uniref:MFS multidrug transporter-like protein n=1 Tax=Apodospora peruviana TaxID=516989 RepID=A0AAE0IQG6_9PEZI|nr:MFS multidrug transporter-like protein [Apodospora peruviana]
MDTDATADNVRTTTTVAEKRVLVVAPPVVNSMEHEKKHNHNLADDIRLQTRENANSIKSSTAGSGSGSGPDRDPNSTSAEERADIAQVDDERGIIYLHGIRFSLIATLIAIMLFLVTIETSIATTSLVAITHDLGGFERASWVMSSYLLGYVAVIVIFAKLSDIYGRKLVFAICIFIFTAFSGGCAAAGSLTQLIILRGIQGVGAGGCFALSAIVIIELVPPNQYGVLVARTGIAIVVAMVLGPIIGGEISATTSWRWIFGFNVPIGLLCLALALFAIPNGFPFHGRLDHAPFRASTPKVAFSRLDLPGFALLMLATLCFTACFQEADSRFAWDSAYVITLLTASVILWLGLLFWERYVTHQNGMREPVLPWRFFTNRGMVGILLGMVLVGAVMTTTAFQLPQRYQVVNGLSSIEAGVRVLPFGGGFPIGLIGSSTAASKLKVPGIYLVMSGAVLQVIGCALLGTQPDTFGINPAVYGYQIICGVGCGITYQILYLMIPFTAEQPDKAVGMGAGNQFRTMGSAFGLAITTSVFNSYNRSQFAKLGISDLLENLTKGDTLGAQPDDVQAVAVRILSDGYNRQMLVLCGFAAAQLPTMLLLWRRKQIVTV